MCLRAITTSAGRGRRMRLHTMANLNPGSATTANHSPSPAAMPLLRSREGRWLAGVCSGLGRGSRSRTAWIRVGFVAATLAGGLGILAYMACWLIVPLDGAGEEDGDSSRTIVVLAQVCAAGMGLLTLGAIAAVATVFGFGWAVFALGAGLLVAVLAAWPRLGPAWAVLPLIAFAVPSGAVAAYGVRLAPRTDPLVVRPRMLHGAAYQAGLGTTLIDLRHTQLPATGSVSLRIDGGIRRTIVALPHDRCVRVDVRYRISPLVAFLGALVLNRPQAFPGLVIFGSRDTAGSGEIVRGGPLDPGPTLRIDFGSSGGSLYVRDYPDSVRPNLEPYWPGFQVFPEPRPDTRGLTKSAKLTLLRAWRGRLQVELRSASTVNPLIPGPCGQR
jgi:phage shock protein PspC (stress-responsive transcriptional regulator)